MSTWQKWDNRFLGKMSPGLFENVGNRTPRVTKMICFFNKSWKMSNGWLMARPLSGNCSQIATLFSPIWIAATLTAIFLVLAIVLELFFSSLWPFSERIDRTLPKAQQTQESSARVIAQTSQELVKVLHTMAKLWKDVAKSLSSSCYEHGWIWQSAVGAA